MVTERTMSSWRWYYNLTTVLDKGQLCHPYIPGLTFGLTASQVDSVSAEGAREAREASDVSRESICYVCRRLNLIYIMQARKNGSWRKFNSLLAARRSHMTVCWLTGWFEHQDEWIWPYLKQNHFPGVTKNCIAWLAWLTRSFARVHSLFILGSRVGVSKAVYFVIFL